MRLVVGPRCIEAAARDAHRRLQSELLLLEESDPGFDERARLLGELERFLRRTDFASLRAARPELAGGTDLEVEVVAGDDPDAFEIRVLDASEAAKI
jgi:hypothetical protein